MDEITPHQIPSSDEKKSPIKIFHPPNEGDVPLMSSSYYLENPAGMRSPKMSKKRRDVSFSIKIRGRGLRKSRPGMGGPYF